MHDILAATRESLAKREAELVALIAEAETRGQILANKANTEMRAIEAEVSRHTEELTGVRHSKATLDSIAAQEPK